MSLLVFGFEKEEAAPTRESANGVVDAKYQEDDCILATAGNKYQSPLSGPTAPPRWATHPGAPWGAKRAGQPENRPQGKGPAHWLRIGWGREALINAAGTNGTGGLQSMADSASPLAGLTSSGPSGPGSAAAWSGAFSSTVLCSSSQSSSLLRRQILQAQGCAQRGRIDAFLLLEATV